MCCSISWLTSRGAGDRSEYRQAAGAIAEAMMASAEPPAMRKTGGSALAPQRFADRISVGAVEPDLPSYRRTARIHANVPTGPVIYGGCRRVRRFDGYVSRKSGRCDQSDGDSGC